MDDRLVCQPPEGMGQQKEKKGHDSEQASVNFFISNLGSILEALNDEHA
jgi:hypothetical protein